MGEHKQQKKALNRQDEHEEQASTEGTEIMDDASSDDMGESSEELAGDLIDALSKEMEALKNQNEQLQHKLLRQMAEFDNYKKRTTREKDDLYSRAKCETAELFLGVLDNFERALETESADQTFQQGVEMIFQQMTQSFRTLGMEEIAALGESFDPDLHNAVNQVEDPEFGANTVCQVLQKGYRMGGKIMRHAMVVVANP